MEFSQDVTTSMIRSLLICDFSYYAHTSDYTTSTDIAVPVFQEPQGTMGSSVCARANIRAGYILNTCCDYT
jgi:hypothetical protein